MRASFPSGGWPIVTIVALVLGSGAAASAQRARWSKSGNDRQEQFGKAVTFLGDLDGDGVPDFAAGAPAFNALPSPHEGVVRVCSGADASLLYELRGPSDVSFGRALANVHDVDGDGVDDVIVGAPSDGTTGAAFLYSGASGAPLLVLRGGTPLSEYGGALAGLGDVDGDGIGDVAIGAPNDHGGSGLVELRSGVDGFVLAQWTGRTLTGQFGARNSIADAGDLDADGVHDLALTEITGLVDLAVELKVYSGTTHTLLLSKTIAPNYSGSFVYSSVSSAGDLDGDGHDDVWLTGSTTAPFETLRGQADLFSGATGVNLLAFESTENGFGVACIDAGDVDRDGYDDIAVSGVTDGLGGFVDIHSGTDGSVLLHMPLADYSYGFSLAGPANVDGDAFPDLLIGAPPFDGSLAGGTIEIRSLKKGKLLLERSGSNAISYLRGGVIFLDDSDGDGRPEVLAGFSKRLAEVDWLVLLSSLDGHEIRRFHRATQDFGGALVPLPDIDGDGRSDFAVGSATGVGSVEVRSGADGSLVRSFTDARTDVNFGGSLAVGVQSPTSPNKIRLAIGTPLSNTAKTGAGEVTVYDAMTGALVVQQFGNWQNEHFGTSVASLGDVNHDGFGDFAVGAPFNGKTATNAGRVVIMSGRNGNQLKALLGGAADDRFGNCVAAAGDVNGDGITDLLVGVPGAGVSDEGAVQLIAGGTWGLLATMDNFTANSGVGELLAGVADANEDGVDDLLTAWPARTRIDLFSGGNGSLLHPIDTDLLAKHLAVAPPWLAGLQGGADGPLLAISDPDDPTGGATAGRIELLELDDLYLQVSPPSAAPGMTASATLRGGPNGAFSGLFLAAIDGVPFNQFFDFGFLDVEGSWSTSAVIPPGLSGVTYTLRGYAIGFGGHTADSQDQTFYFE